AAGRPALPPCHRRHWRTDRLRGRAGAQGATPRPRGRPPDGLSAGLAPPGRGPYGASTGPRLDQGPCGASHRSRPVWPRCPRRSQARLAPNPGSRRTRSTPMSTTTDTARLHQRVAAADWTQLAEELDTYGCALTPRLLTPAQCARIAGLYERGGQFRN